MLALQCGGEPITCFSTIDIQPTAIKVREITAALFCPFCTDWMFVQIDIQPTATKYDRLRLFLHLRGFSRFNTVIIELKSQSESPFGA